VRNSIGQKPLHTAIATWIMMAPLAIGGAATLATVHSAIAPPAQANEALQWSFDPAQQQLLITIPNGASPRYFLLAEPPRIVVDVPGTVGNWVEDQAYAGAVRHIRVGQSQPGVTRIVMELSPQVVFAPGQVEVSAAGGDRWVVRPLLADSASVAAAPILPESSAPSSTPSTAAIAAPSVSDQSDQSDSTALPPLEPGAVELDVLSPSAPEATPPAELAEASAPESEVADSSPDLSTELFAPFPELSSAPIDEPVTEMSQSDSDGDAIADAPTDSGDEGSIAINVENADRATPAPAPNRSMVPTNDGSVSMLEFGQPLSTATDASVLVPAGTRLTLRYPGERSLQLSMGAPRQDVLLLHQPVTDSSGRVVVPANTQVLGRFETSTAGSRFIVQALSVNGQNIPVEGQSGWLGDRSVSDADLIRNAAIGAAAGTVLTTLTGDMSGVALIGGAAAGAATTYITAPEPAVIQPNQLIDVQLTEDLAVR
jgi:hypothetical protein